MSKENLDEVIDFIVDNNLIAKKDKIGVAVSGGVDSMSLLHFLHELGGKTGFEVVALHVDHKIRKSSKNDAKLVGDFCAKNEIPYQCFRVDVPAYAAQTKIGLEQAGRIQRYQCFEKAIKKYDLTKIALGHHAGDQAETILLHIFRGSGAGGATGMDARRGIYIRPFLESEKKDLISYAFRNGIKYIYDETNDDNSLARNFLRNQVIPSLQNEWRNVEKNIADFGKLCRADNEYLNSLIDTNSLVIEPDVVKIPINLFAYPEPIMGRIVLYAFERLGERENIEKKHVTLLATLAQMQNGAKVDLPNGLYAAKEYEFISIVRRNTGTAQNQVFPFKKGKTAIPEFGTIIVDKSVFHRQLLAKGLLLIDVDKLPRKAKWRFRKDGDMFTKFGGGTKQLSAYLIDKKVPVRQRAKVPVLALGNEIYAVAGHDISDKVKADDKTTEVYMLEFTKE